MITKRLVGLVFAFQVGLIPSFAAAADPCANPVNSAEVNDCAAARAMHAEKAMTTTYRQLLSGLNKAEAEFAKTYPRVSPITLKSKLVAAQREWVKFRAQSCNLESQLVLAGNPSRGDRPSQAQTSCQASLAEARTIQLKALAETYGIDRTQ